jgi:uncharacterized repeat protein (TIGR01451 family)
MNALSAHAQTSPSTPRRWQWPGWREGGTWAAPRRALLLCTAVTLALMTVTLMLLLLAASAAWLPNDRFVAAASGVRYVASSGMDTGACSDPGSPCRSVQYAVDQATSGDEVRIATGVYTQVNALGGLTQAVYISKSVSLRGGYTLTNWTQPDAAANPTTLDAQGLGRVIYITGSVRSALEGLRLIGGDATALGGDGGGAYILSATVTLSHTQVFSNAALRGGGLFLSDGDLHLEGDIFHSNVAGQGGGLYLSRCTGVLTNNVIADNQVLIAGAGLYVDAASPHLLHTTFARNGGGDGSGIDVTGVISAPSTVVLTNTVLISHSVGITVTAGNTAALEATLWGNGIDWGGGGAVVTGTHNLWGAPDFLDPEGGDYHIGPASAARDAGVDAGVAVDIDGEARPVGSGPDLGADEFPAALALVKEADPPVVQAGAGLTYTLYITNAGAVTLNGVITDTLPAQVTPTGSLTWTLLGLAPSEAWTRTVHVTVEASYLGTLTNVVRATTTEGAAGIYTATAEVARTPRLQVSKRADPNPVWAGRQLTYTIHITNAGNVVVSAMLFDTPPQHVSPSNLQVWMAPPLLPGAVWSKTLVVTVETAYSGTLINVVSAQPSEGDSVGCSAIVAAIQPHGVYLPLALGGP